MEFATASHERPALRWAYRVLAVAAGPGEMPLQTAREERFPACARSDLAFRDSCWGLDAPAVAFCVFQGALHFAVQGFHKPCSSNGFAARSDQVRGPKARTENAHYRLFDPVSFEVQAKGVAEHHGGAQN